MARQQFIAPNINFREPDASTAGLNIITEAISRAPENVLCNAAGFGGTNSCLLLRFAE
jgi:3-oxoacyl-[acyl-carrier-protein] synthase-1